MTPLMVDVLLVTLPMVAVAAITWCLVWPRWKLVVKILLHPCLYAALSFYVGHWSVLLAWLHQGLFGLGGHIWFCSKHGFTWYAVEDPQCYVRISREAVRSLGKRM